MLLISGGSIFGVILFAWLYARKSIQEALRKRELNQQMDALIKNKQANKRKAARDKSRKKRVGDSVDLDDPWSGLRD